MRTAHGFLFAILAVTATTSTLSAAPWLTFSEVHYRPHADAALEFVEIYNLDAPSVDLRGWRLTGAVAFEFARGTRIGPRACMVSTIGVPAGWRGALLSCTPLMSLPSIRPSASSSFEMSLRSARSTRT